MQVPGIDRLLQRDAEPPQQPTAENEETMESVISRHYSQSIALLAPLFFDLRVPFVAIAVFAVMAIAVGNLPFPLSTSFYELILSIIILLLLVFSFSKKSAVMLIFALHIFLSVSYSKILVLTFQIFMNK